MAQVEASIGHFGQKVKDERLIRRLVFSFCIWKARAGEISMEDMSGGTFTISNGIILFARQYQLCSDVAFLSRWCLWVSDGNSHSKSSSISYIGHAWDFQASRGGRWTGALCLQFCASSIPPLQFLTCQVVIRPMMYVALSYDHRIIDGLFSILCYSLPWILNITTLFFLSQGSDGVLFLKDIKNMIEDPTRLLLEL